MRSGDFFRVVSRDGGLTTLVRVARFDPEAAIADEVAANDGTLAADASSHRSSELDPPDNR